MAEVNPNIPLAFNPAPIGPNLGNSIATAASLMKFQQDQQEVDRQNKLRGILGSPGAVDPKTGQPTPETMSRVMGVDPNAGLKLQQNALVTQQHRLQLDALTTKTAYDQSDMLNNAYAPIMEQYKQNVEKGMPEPAARTEAQRALDQANQRLKGAGLPPNVVTNLPTKFEASEFERRAMQTTQYQQWWREHQRIKEDAKKDARAGEQMWNDPDGKPFILRPNMPPGKNAVYLDGSPVPSEVLTGARRAGPGGQKVEDITVDGERTQGYLVGTQWHKLDGTPIPTTTPVQRVGKQVASGLKGDALDTEAISYAMTGQFPQGRDSPADRDAIRTRAAEIDRKAGITPEMRADSRIGAQADMASLRRTVMQRDAISGYEKGAEKEFDLAQSLIPRTPEPLNMQLLTQWTRSGEKQFGDVPNAQFYVALVSALDEYAKVIGGSTSSAAASTDSARTQALSLIPPGATTAQIKGIIETIKQGMNNRREGYDQQIDEIRQRRGAKPLAGPRADRAPPSGGQTPPAAPTPYQPGQPIPSEAAEKLRSKPSDALRFDEIFGPGSAEKVLKGNGAGAPSKPSPAPAQQTPRRGLTAADAVRPTTQAEFDDVKTGEYYINPADGKPYRKK